MNILIKHCRCLKWLYSILFYVIIYLLLYWVLCFFGGSLFLLIFLDKFISRKVKGPKCWILTCAQTNGWRHPSLFLQHIEAFECLWMFYMYFWSCLLDILQGITVKLLRSVKKCGKILEIIIYDVKTKPFSPAEPYINNVKKIHLLQIKYNYDWCSAALAAVHVNYYILKLQGPQQNSLGSSEDICRCCGIHIPHCAHSQSSVLFMQARLVHLSSWIRIQTHALTNTREYITDFIGGMVSEITESWVKVR